MTNNHRKLRCCLQSAQDVYAEVTQGRSRGKQLHRIGSLTQANSILSAGMTVSYCRLDIGSHVRPIETLSHCIVHARLTWMTRELVGMS